MKFILKKKLKHGTKEILKIFNLCLISFGFIIAIVLIKYRPVYEVKISDTSVGYIQNKKAFEEIIENYIENYEAKNVKNVELEEEPKLELKLVNKTQETNESEVTIALQKELKITYEYYEIALNNEVLATVDTMEEAQEIVAEANEKAAAIREDAENDHKERIERTNEDVENILTKASDTITDMFEESAKARKQIVASHNTLMNSARANQDKLLAIMVEQKDLFKGQVEIATSNELEDIFTKSQFRLTSAENFLESRHREYSETLKNLKNNASR